MDLLHAYSKQSGRVRDPSELLGRASQSRRPSASETRASRRSRQLKPDEITFLIAHYRDLGSVAAAAQAIGVTRQTAAKHLKYAGVATLRGMTPADIASAILAYRDGQSAARIGRRLGFDPQTIITALRAADVSIRYRPGR